MSALTDDEAIALATLLGCEFYHRISQGDWFVDARVNFEAHPLERQRAMVENPNDAWGWPTKAALAHDFVAWHLEHANGS